MATSKKKKPAKQAKAKRGATKVKPAKKKGASAKRSTAKKAAPKKKVAAKKAAKRPAKKASTKAAMKAPKKKTVAAKGKRIADRPVKADRSSEPEERVKPFHQEMEEEEPQARRREPVEPVELGEEMEDELGNGMSLDDDDEETGADFLDKPEELSSDEDTE